MQNVIRIRRPRLDTELQRANVALRAVAALGVGYSWIAALRLGWRMNSGLWNPGGLITYGRRIICSKVFFDAHLEIARLPLQGCQLSGLISPAHLSATVDLDDVHIPWLRIS